MDRRNDSNYLNLVFIGDSRVRQIFFDFVKIMPDYDLHIEPKLKSYYKLHRDVNFTSNVLNLRLSFYWRPFFGDSIEDFVPQSIQNLQTEMVEVILIGLSTHHMLHESNSNQQLYAQGLTKLAPVLQRIANTSTRVIWLRQYPVIDFYGSSESHNTDIFSAKIHQFNKESERILRLFLKLPLKEPWDHDMEFRKFPDIEMLQAVENVAKTFSHENEELKKNLIAKLESITDESEVARLEPFKPDKQKTADLTNLLNTLKVDVKKPKKKAPESHLAAVKIDNVYGADPSGIFRNAKFNEDSRTVSKLTTWEMLYQRELELLATQPPNNGFQQMILWTKQGKVWQFPIDNEQGLEEEAQVGFHEHVFLEPHLKPWCPRRGPVRHFMELVIIGLSKNPYITVAQKKEHINWFCNFFEAQRSILIETGAIPDAPSQSPPSLSA
uniref:Small ribosomal subunit protein mS31 n=1 Tax=Daphnia longispina TaxID=42846 RepID=A0A4Y7M9D8_9CRUS|nr:EOG090X04UC [Daphnia longispina]